MRAASDVDTLDRFRKHNFEKLVKLELTLIN